MCVCVCMWKPRIEKKRTLNALVFSVRPMLLNFFSVVVVVANSNLIASVDLFFSLQYVCYMNARAFWSRQVPTNGRKFIFHSMLSFGFAICFFFLSTFSYIWCLLNSSASWLFICFFFLSSHSSNPGFSLSSFRSKAHMKLMMIIIGFFYICDFCVLPLIKWNSSLENIIWIKRLDDRTSFCYLHSHYIQLRCQVKWEDELKRKRREILWKSSDISRGMTSDCLFVVACIFQFRQKVKFSNFFVPLACTCHFFFVACLSDKWRVYAKAILAFW